jgi:ABC-2 type transport system ATP-binding protein
MVKQQNKAIVVKDLKKSFKLPHENHSGLKQVLINVLQRNKKSGFENQKVLNNISFEVQEGDFFGIVGRNGSGKSTLLKLLAGIYNPDSGSIATVGSVVPFIELGVGFNPELTGRENIFLNGALLGFSKLEMTDMYEEIVSFAELEGFMDQKLKNYSSGMQVRLAFSIAIKAKGDILILDEVLAVGDEAFQRKCYQYFTQLRKEKKTVILVTHSMDSVQQFCNKAIMIEKGEIIASGNPAKVAQKYRELFMPKSTKDGVSENTNQDENIIQPVKLNTKLEKTNKHITINMQLIPKIDINDCIVTLFLDRDNGEQVYRFASDEKTGDSLYMKSGKSIKLKLELQNIFPNGIFTLRASIKSRDRTIEHMLASNISNFEIDRRSEGNQWDIHWQPNETFSIN